MIDRMMKVSVAAVLLAVAGGQSSLAQIGVPAPAATPTAPVFTPPPPPPPPAPQPPPAPEVPVPDLVTKDAKGKLVALGIPTESAYLQRYCERTGRADAAALTQDWNFYLAYNLFRLAAILQGIAKRAEQGTASSDQAKASGAGARPLAQLAWQFAQRAQHAQASA